MLFRFHPLRQTLFIKPIQHQTRCYSSPKPFDPLRILFCGADEFSIPSLAKLNDLKNSRPDCISSIDVVCRPDKAVGRKLKQIRQVPIKPVAQELNLPLHQIDTFTNWQPPPTDLVITVSFGLLVPARILTGARYGGLNVHPSLLPDLRGPAPIQHALLQERRETGVSLQTMHPTKFDRGEILMQRKALVRKRATVEGMVGLLGNVGAEMLVEGIENGVFVEPKGIDIEATGQEIHAPKITPQDRKISDWKTITADEIDRKDWVLGNLWDDTLYSHCFATSEGKRITYVDGWTRFSTEDAVVEHRVPWEEGGKKGVVIFQNGTEKGRKLGMELACGTLIAPEGATIEGEKRGVGARALKKAISNRKIEAGS